MQESTDAPWFESWFNSQYYHILYGKRDEAEALNFIESLLAHLDIDSGSKVLDLACGKGRHSKSINQKGHDVIGIDLSDNSIEQAKKLESETLEFYVHDMRQLYWKDHFNLVVNLFTSFGYFHNSEDDQRTMNGVFNALIPGGIFVIDFMNAKKVVDNLVDHEEKNVNGVEFIIDRKVEDGVIEKAIQIVDNESKFRFVEEVDALFLSDFKSLLKAAGFEIKSLFGDYGLNPFNEADSDRLIIVAQKPND